MPHPSPHPIDKLRADASAFAMYLASAVRAGLEDMHVEGTLTPEMRRLNTAVRNSLYTALCLADAARAGDSLAYRSVRQAIAALPAEWEPPALLPHVRDVLGPAAVTPRCPP